MGLPKVFAAAFCAAVVALQAYTMLPGRAGNGWYWPFVNYPMYSRTHRAGDSFSRLDLRAVPCTPGGAGRPISGEHLRVKWAPYKLMLLEAAGLRDTSTPEVAERAIARLRTLAATRLPFQTCRLQLWAWKFTVGPSGLEPTDSTWRLAGEWSLLDTTSSGPRTTPTSAPQ